MLGVSQSSDQGLKIKVLIPAALRAEASNDKEEVLYFPLLLDIL